MAARYLAKFDDPTGERHGLPTYPWKTAPTGLATRRQLRIAGLAPGGHDPVAQVMWRGRGGDRVAFLYDVTLARPKRAASPAVMAAIDKALTARRTCASCGVVRPYYIPTSLGECLHCAAPDLYETVGDTA